jgi:lipoyl(octanoyl) transferase
MRLVKYLDLGTIDYQEAWDLQTELFEGIIARKLENRTLPAEEQIQQVSYLLFCEHPHVYTLGRNGAEENMLLDEAALAEKGASFVKINRGGDITYHGFGQIVGYPLLDLDEFFTDIGRYIRFMEEMVIRTLADYGIESGRIAGQSGVWLDWEAPTARKICAVGVHLSRWVTMHGFAFNINTKLDYFNNIIPCGISDKGVTSLAQELGYEIDLGEVKLKLLQHFKDLFDAEIEITKAN